MARTQPEYEYTTQVIKGDNYIITVRRPILPPEEYERRMNRLKEATADFLKAYYASQAKKNKNNGGNSNERTL